MKYVLFIFPIFWSTHCDAQTIELHDDWEFREAGSERWYPATVPGTVHTDLLAAGLIPDPYYGTNEDSVQWVSGRDWEYRCRFDVADEQFGRTHMKLRFHGLDTYADVRLNDSLLLRSDNMFRTYDLDIKPVVKERGNTLVVLFRSPIAEGDRRLQVSSVELPGDAFSNGMHSSMFTRKAAYHYGWDWGPRLVTSGIWRPLELIAWNVARIDRVSVRTDSIANNVAWMTAEVRTEGKAGQVAFDWRSPEGASGSELMEIRAGTQATIRFQIDRPELWWPNGSGTPSLYQAHCALSQGGQLVDSTSTSFGVRTIDLVQEKDSIGTSFFFMINGEPLFMRGANYIPQDMFLPRVSDAMTTDLLSDVRNANMNMLRVWGGGVYESDTFYDLCDRYGILIWQDLMFANALYPADTGFFNNVSAEIVDQVERLNGHACIALFCGNNEVDVAWRNWGWQEKYGPSEKSSLERNYARIFQELAPGIISDKAPRVPYVHTSPLSNWGTTENFDHHNMHYWGVWHGKDEFSGYTRYVPRFMSEYGFQSYPDMTMLQKIGTATDLEELEGPVLDAHQKSYVGSALMDRFGSRYFRTPVGLADRIFISQLTQQLALRTAIQAHRTDIKCMGTLYWQLNDVWPGLSWSTRDHAGKWKAGMFEVQRLYAPFTVITVGTDGAIASHVINDTRASRAYEFEITLKDLHGMVLEQDKIEFRVGANTRIKVWSAAKEVWLKGHDPTKSYLLAQVKDGDQVIAEDHYFFTDPHSIALTDPTIKMERTAAGTLAIRSDRLVYGLHLTAEGVLFLDDFVLLEAGRPIEIMTDPPITDQDLGRITWRSFVP